MDMEIEREVDKKLKDRGADSAIDEILDRSVVSFEGDNDDTLGKDLQEIAKQITNDDNVMRFTTSFKDSLAWEALFYSFRKRPEYKKNVKPRYEWARYFQYGLNVHRSALKGNLLEKFVETAQSLIGFRGGLEYREAGVRPVEEKKQGFVNRLLKR